MTASYAAVDLGATSGRVMVGHVATDGLALEEVHRFDNRAVRTLDGLHWPVLTLYQSVVDGLARLPAVRSVGIDGWAVDYGLMRDGRLLSLPYAYRDERNHAAVRAVHARIPPAALYQRNGLQHLPFNTLFQLTADRTAGLLDLVDSFLLLPDLFAYWLTGVAAAERTNASTTGLLGVNTGDWDRSLASSLSIPQAIFPPLVEPGTELGPSSLGPVVTAVGSHDTASAVVAVPASSPDFAYISSGTWSLVGVELAAPVVSEAARLAGFTNEGGVDGRVRFLHNVMGLWLLNECARAWRVPVPSLVDEAAAARTDVPAFDTGDPAFLAPADMPGAITEWFAARGVEPPSGRAELSRSILVSLASAYADAISSAVSLSGVAPQVIHIVGGGSRNDLLCQLTADATGLPVLAGPVEATAIGNILVQARAHGTVGGSLEALRSLVGAAFPPVRYAPGTHASAHTAARP